MRKIKAEDLFEISPFKLMRSVGDNNIYFRHSNGTISKDTRIYRYVQLDHMMEMLDYSYLYVGNREKFTDIREWSGEEKFIPTARVPYAIKPCYSYRDRTRIKKEEKIVDTILKLCVSCWTLDELNNGLIDENFLMWKAYKSGDLMCRIGTTIGKLIDNIEPQCDVLISDVTYRSSGIGVNTDNMTFNKSIYYCGEREVRAVFLNTSSQLKIRIKNIDDFIDSVTLSPFLHPKIESFLMTGLKRHYRKYETKFQSSKLMEYNNKKEAIEINKTKKNKNRK